MFRTGPRDRNQCSRGEGQKCQEQTGLLGSIVFDLCDVTTPVESCKYIMMGRVEICAINFMLLIK